MSHSQDEFGQLRRLLTCKRYEQPPPGFFNHFSDRVIARIEVEEFGGKATWWSWLMEKFEAKPVLACACGLAVSSLLLIGFKLSEFFEYEIAAVPPVSALDQASIPNHRAFPGAFGSVGLFERPVVAYSTSLSPAFRPEPLADWYRGNNLQVQAIGFNFNH